MRTHHDQQSTVFTKSLPRLVVSLGIHGSASTWVFNVLREIMLRHVKTEDLFLCVGHDLKVVLGSELEKAPVDQYVLWKAHHTERNVDSLFWLAKPPIVASIRDPRDAVVSLVSRFNVPLQVAITVISKDCATASRYANAGHMVLRFEDNFFDDPGLPERLAGQIGMPISSTFGVEIFRKYTTERVKAFAERVDTLPPDLLLKSNYSVWDKVTQIYKTHIGDGRVGKWKDILSATEKAMLTEPFPDS